MGWRRKQLTYEFTSTNVIVADNSTGTADHFNWPATFAGIRTDLTVVNRSVGGWEIETHSPSGVGAVSGFYDEFSTQILPFIDSDPDVRNIVLVRECMNRLTYNFNDQLGGSYGHGFTNGASVYTAAKGLGDLIDLIHANGAEAWLVTPIYWEDPDYNRAAYRAATDQLTAAILANTRGADGVLDLAATTPQFDPVTDTEGDYNGDVHPTSSGAGRIATALAALSVGQF
jgi:hypothetical protein